MVAGFCRNWINCLLTRPKKGILMKNRRTKMIKLSLMATLCGLCLTPTIFAGMHGNSQAFGKTLAGWNDTYWRWAFGVLAVPPDANGNPLVPPHVGTYAVSKRSRRWNTRAH